MTPTLALKPVQSAPVNTFCIATATFRILWATLPIYRRTMHRGTQRCIPVSYTNRDERNLERRALERVKERDFSADEVCVRGFGLAQAVSDIM